MDADVDAAETAAIHPAELASDVTSSGSFSFCAAAAAGDIMDVTTAAAVVSTAAASGSSCSYAAAAVGAMAVSAAANLHT